MVAKTKKVEKAQKISKSQKPEDSLKVQNIVATTSLEEEVSLSKLARTQPNTEYNPETFPGLVLRIKQPKSAVLVFSSGNLVCTGVKSIAQVREVIDQVIKQLKKIGVHVKIKPKINVQNIVASGSINLDLNLNTLSLELENTEYEPEQFPGLVYKLENPTATFLLFSNGKLVCTGTKNKEQLEESMRQLNKNVRAALKRLKENGSSGELNQSPAKDLTSDDVF
jgi:transcription initiation factor TFIID TATA-box-binding protein